MPLFASFLAASAASAAAPQPALHSDSNPDPSLVTRALQAEITAARDTSHPMRYRLRKSSPRLTTVKELIETKDGQVALLTSVNDAQPSAEDAQKEQARLDELLANPGKQRHRKQQEDADMDRVMKVLYALPAAFLYQDAGPVSNSSGSVEKFTFAPNPKFSPPDLETQVLTQMTGEIWIDTAHERVAHLEGRLRSDVDFGWGVLGRLYKGGSVSIDQAEVSSGQWRIVHFKMKMTGRVLFKTRSFDTVEEETHFTPVPGNLDYKQAIRILRDNQRKPISDAR